LYRNPDLSGNIFETKERKDRKYDKGGRLIESKNAFYKYDDEGFLTEKKEFNGNIWSYEWNAAGWLVKVTKPDKNEVYFKYDAVGRRIEKKCKGTTTKWLWDGNKLLNEWKVFDTKESSSDDTITWVFKEQSHALAGKIKGEKKYSIVGDQVGSPIRAYNQQGELIWSRELDCYGRIRMLKGDAGFCNCLYMGQSLDLETGLAYNRFRYYAPEEGLYISQDPIGLNGGQLNLYSHVKDPNIWVDVFGLVGGGSYREVRDTNEGGEVHHMPANSVNRDTGSAGRDTGPAIHMSTEDHAQTASHGSQGIEGAEHRAQQRAHIDNGRYDLAMAMDIRDVRDTFPGRYTNSMLQAIQYAVDRDPPLITEEQARNLRRQCTR
jgi:RHS repeat-associated protein